MRINETNRANMLQAYNKANKAQSTNDSKKSMGRDEVNISDQAMELAKLETEDNSPARKERLQELKHQIEAGTYHVPSEKIAEKFLSFWKKS